MAQLVKAGPKRWPFVVPRPENYPTDRGLTDREAAGPPPAQTPPPGGIMHALRTDAETHCGRLVIGFAPDERATGTWVWSSCEGCVKAGQAYGNFMICRQRELEKVHAVDLSRYPHACPTCGGPAYVGLFLVDCAGSCAPGKKVMP